MLRVHWTEVQRAELEVLRDRGQPAYLRERAAALPNITGNSLGNGSPGRGGAINGAPGRAGETNF
jgi:hypothetical protein